METVLVQANNQEISRLAGQWLDAIEQIPSEHRGVRLALRQKSQNLLNYINQHSDVKVCGTVCASLKMNDLLQRSKEYAAFVHSLPVEITILFNSQFEEFWESLVKSMK
jgi:hypothetical protein